MAGIHSVRDEIVIVFGGLGGIGQACCELLLNTGCRVLCADIAEVNSTFTSWRDTHHEDVQFYQCDITDRKQIRGAFKRCIEEFRQPAQIVINTAGIIDEFSVEDCINVNLIGVIHVCSICIEQMGRHRGGGGGVLVQFSSILGLGPGPNVPVYSAAAHGIVGYIRSMSHPLHFGDHGVRMNVVCPTAVDTNLLVSSLERMHKPEILSNMLHSLGGKSSIFKPSTIADEVLKIISDIEIHGQVIRISKITGVEHVQFEEQPPV